MSFEVKYDSANTVPSEVKHLYKDDGTGSYVLLGAGEVKTAKDVANVQEGLRKERDAHKETKKKLQAFNGMDPEQVQSKLDRIAELEAAAGGKLDENKINEMVEVRIKSRTAPLERQINKLTEDNTTYIGEIESYKKKDIRRKIRDSVFKAATDAKLRTTAIEDALLMGERIFTVDENDKVVTKDNVGVTPGVDSTVWLTEVKNSRPHWWPESQGVGASGGSGANGGGNNPFSAEHWNMTEQGKLVKENIERAEQMAKAAGTTIGGSRPQAKK
jgi:hypothetical protein